LSHLGNGEKDLPTAKAVRPTERERRSPLAKSLLVAKATNREARKTIGKSGSSIWAKPKAREGRASGRERVSPDARFLALRRLGRAPPIEMRLSAESRYTRTWGRNNHWPVAPAPATSVWGTSNPLQY